MTETESSFESRARHCLGCGYQLNRNPTSSCPECGRTFDRTHRGTFGDSPRSGLRRYVVRLLFLILLWLLSLLLCAVITTLFLGWDPLNAFLLSLAAAPLMGGLMLLALVPSIEVRPAIRVLAILVPVLIVLTSWPVFPSLALPFANWPFRFSFVLHRPALERLATRIRDTGQTRASSRVGVLWFIDTQFTDPGKPQTSNLGLQLTGGDHGGVHLVQTGSDGGFVWFNTNWEIDLGGGWHLVYQD